MRTPGKGRDLGARPSPGAGVSTLAKSNLSGARASLHHREEPEELGEKPGRQDAQILPLRHGAHMISSTERGLGPGTPDPVGLKHQFHVCHRPSPPGVTRSRGQSSLPHFPVGGTEAWKQLRETGVVGASLPRLQNIRVSTSYVLPGPRHPHQPGDSRIHGIPPARTTTHIWPPVSTLHRGGISETRAPTTGRGLCQGPRSGQSGMVAAFPCPCPQL